MAYVSEILLGRIIKISGHKGAVVLKLESSFIENIPRLESVFLEIDGRLVPFFISDLEYSGADILKLKFRGYESIKMVSGFIGCQVFLTTEKTKKPDSKFSGSFEKYTVLGENGDFIGIIEEVIPNQGQHLLSVRSAKKKVVLIPYHEDLITDIDHTKRVIVLELPAGLIDIN